MGTLIQHCRLLAPSNSFWLAVVWMTWEFGQHLDPTWLAAHPSISTWLPPTLAALAVLVKIFQNAAQISKTEGRHHAKR